MTTTIHSLPRIMVEPVVRAALLEDVGRSGDITSQAVVPAGTQAHLQLVARESGVLAGIEVAKLAFMLMDENCSFDVLCEDGTDLQAGTVIADIQGDARAMLTAERTALNFLGHLSGIASATRPIARAIAPYGTKVSCTRKTLPGMRMLQKYAVRVGGGSNHRFGLDDAVLIKDNHVAIAGGVRAALTRAKENVGHLVKVELEVDTLEQLDEALQCGVDVVLLDNMPIPMLKEAVQRIGGRAICEASGGITPESTIAVAQTGVNQIAMGWLTHSVRVLDIGLDSV
ncbi:carboxylating nicotinate-nucleotide diphosphorylase [Paenalcaligenes sp. Me52]|uniref:carboxylating nicotinate-nucleotide diphosphorylase n=1 Tax=Paenalcaligenes sp. Me52 TaxID=3392038 RepID=UPI003D27834A